MYNGGMKLIMLSGMSIKNKDWIEDMETEIRKTNAATQVMYYDHWADGENMIDVDRELDKLEDITRSIREYNIFAKSAGTWITMKGVYESRIKPARCVFVGTALLQGRELNAEYDKWLAAYNIPTLFIQKTSDPAIGFAGLKKELKNSGLKDFKAKEIPGDTHNYEDVAGITKMSLEFLNS